jgi:hypothetical protein
MRIGLLCLGTLHHVLLIERSGTVSSRETREVVTEELVGRESIADRRGEIDSGVQRCARAPENTVREKIDYLAERQYAAALCQEHVRFKPGFAA